MVRIKVVLNALTVCIALIGYLPLQPYLDPFACWFFPAALLTGLYLQGKRPLPARVLTPLSLLLFLYFVAGFTVARLIPITADLLVVFLGIRMLGERSGRNALQVFALALFSLAASSLYDLSALFLVYLLLLLFFIAVSLVVLTVHGHDARLVLRKAELKKVLTVSCLMPIASLPILLCLFVLLPRTQYPLWDFLNRSAPRATGFSDKVNPGGSASVAEVKSVVLRAVCAKVPVQSLYWRGIVLNGFSGNAWVRLPAPEERGARAESGVGVHQEIYPEPTNNPYLLALNLPSAVSGVRCRQSDDAVWVAQRTLDKRVKYEAESRLSEAIAVPGGIDRDFYLRLPEQVSPRVRAKGAELARQGGTAREKIALLERFFREQRLAYATVGLPTGRDPLDSFLFEKRVGNCEFFASACATLLRLAGVPARLVGGYHGGTYSEVGGYYLVTEEMAHVWVEAYVAGRGWLLVDPSAWSRGFGRSGDRVLKLRMYVDAVGFYWSKAVITYDLEKQLSLVMKAGGKMRGIRLPTEWWRPLIGIALALSALAVLGALYRWNSRTPQEKLLARLRRVIRRRYRLDRVEQLGLYELAERVDDQYLREFVRIYGEAVYRDRRLSRDECARLSRLLRRVGRTTGPEQPKGTGGGGIEGEGTRNLDLSKNLPQYPS